MPQGGLEIPCILTFQAFTEKECEKAKKLIKSALLVKIKPLVLEDLTDLNLSEENASSPQQVEDSVTVDGSDKYTLTTSDVEPPQKKQKLCDSDVERIIMGGELTDVHINIAQNLLKKQFPNLGSLQCTLLQVKGTSIEIKSKKVLQIVHCLDRHHWIVASTIDNGKMKSKFLIQYSGMLIRKQNKFLVICLVVLPSK